MKGCVLGLALKSQIKLIFFCFTLCIKSVFVHLLLQAHREDNLHHLHAGGCLCLSAPQHAGDLPPGLEESQAGGHQWVRAWHRVAVAGRRRAWRRRDDSWADLSAGARLFADIRQRKRSEGQGAGGRGLQSNWGLPYSDVITRPTQDGWLSVPARWLPDGDPACFLLSQRRESECREQRAAVSDGAKLEQHGAGAQQSGWEKLLLPASSSLSSHLRLLLSSGGDKPTTSWRGAALHVSYTSSSHPSLPPNAGGCAAGPGKPRRHSALYGPTWRLHRGHQGGDASASTGHPEAKSGQQERRPSSPRWPGSVAKTHTLTQLHNHAYMLCTHRKKPT